jgi:DNA-binding response OmpR family regulator
LIHDDDIDISYVLKIFLKTRGYQVETLHDPKDIFLQISSFKPDLLIIDVILEGDDGREICRQLKASDENQELGILLTSASSTNLKDYKAGWLTTVLKSHLIFMRLKKRYNLC